jgi:nitrogen fixation-related uncharacterized protein
MKNNQWKMTFIAGLLTVLVFINLSCFSWSLFPGEFTPITHQFSDLGINLLNPRGAIYYKLALILSGIGLYFFFWGLNCWKTGDDESNRKLKNTILFGFFSVIWFLVFGVILFFQPPDISRFAQYSAVFRFVNANLSLFGIAIFSLYQNLRTHPKMTKWLSIYSFVVGIIHYVIAIAYIFSSWDPTWLSWLANLSWLLFVVFFSFQTKKAFGY